MAKAKKTIKLIKKRVRPKKAEVVKSLTITAKQFVKILSTHRSVVELKKIQRYFNTGKGGNAEGDTFIGVRMGTVFMLAKEYMDMSLVEVEKLLQNPIHEVRAGGVSIMDFQARNKKTTNSRRKELFDLYIRCHDRIDNWDLVDRSSIYVVGGYLFDKPRKALYQLARSKSEWERRTAIVSTAYFMKQRDVEDTFAIAKLLLNDSRDLMHKATGWMLRTAGTVDKDRLIDFLEEHAANMPRAMLRNAIEHFSKSDRNHYLGLKK